MYTEVLRRRPCDVSLWLSVAISSVVARTIARLWPAASTKAFFREPTGFPTEPGAPTGVPTFTSNDPDEPGKDRSANETKAPTDEPVAEQVSLAISTRALAAVEESILVRAEAGTCESPRRVEFTSDGGAAWALSATFAYTVATQILLILPARAALVHVVALSRECEPQTCSVENLSGTWLEPISAVGAWYVNPTDGESIGRPDGALATVCDENAMAPPGDRSAILCGYSTITASADRGISWDSPVSVPGTLAINTSLEGYVMALQGDETREGVRTGEFFAGILTPHEDCAPLDTTVENVSPGTITLAESGGELYLWAGESFVVSNDGGGTWQ